MCRRPPAGSASAGTGNLAASVVGFPVVVQLAMVELVGVTWVQTSGCPVIGGPTVPVVRTWFPESLPLFAPELGIVTMARGEQLTGMSLPRKKITGCESSELHCTIDASAPGEKPVPATATVSPPARPLQTGAAGLVLLQDAPAAVVLRCSVVVAAALTWTTLVANRVPPASTATAPTVVTSLMTPERHTGQGPSAAMDRPPTLRSLCPSVWTRTRVLSPTLLYPYQRRDSTVNMTRPRSVGPVLPLVCGNGADCAPRRVLARFIQFC